METATVVVNTDLMLVKEELHDPDVMNAILADKSFSHIDLRNLSAYKRARSHGNHVKVIYAFAKGYEESQLGRLYPDGVGLQSFPFDIRNPLLEKYYWDCDMENAHYNILANLADSWSMKTEHIRIYLNNRERELTKLSANRRIAKTAFLKVAYGGNIELYNKHYKDVTVPEGDHTLVNAIRQEMIAIVETCWLRNAKYHKLVKKAVNPKFSLFALILQTEERKCLLAMDAYLKTQNRQMDIYIHDGGEVRKLDGETEFPEALLRGMEKAVLETTGYTVPIKVKPFEHSFVAPEHHILSQDIIVNDKYACEQFIKYMGNNILIDNKIIYIFDKNTGIWSNDESMLDILIAGASNHLQFRQLNKLGILITYDYCGTVKNCKNLKLTLPAVCALTPSCTNPFFINEAKQKSFKKLLFKNGIYDFETDTFTEGFDRTIMFFSAIPFNFNRNVAAEDYEFVYDAFFRSPFESSEMPDLYLHYLMRGMIGDYRCKKYITAIGFTNSSKGMFVNFMEYAFGNVVGTFESGNMLYRKNVEASRENSFLINMCNRRLNFSSEIKEGDEMSGAMLKKVVSGGDVIKARHLFKEDQDIVNRSMLIMLCNDAPKINPPDSAVAERMIPIQYTYSFVSEPRLHIERKMDPNLKEKLQQKKYAEAIVQIFIKEYAKWKSAEFKEPILSANVRLDREELCPVEDIRPLLCQRYELTENPEDCVSNDDLKRYFKDKEVPLSENKIGRLLTSIGLKSVVKNYYGVNKRFRIGIKEKDLHPEE